MRIKNIFGALLITIFIILFIGGIIQYDGNKFNYLIFSLFFLYIIFNILYKQFSYSYFFLSLFLFLGFWLKLTLHSIFQYSYIEPIGNFYLFKTNMDSVLNVVIVGIVGILFSGVFLKNFFNVNTLVLNNKTNHIKNDLYIFYSSNRVKILLVILVTACIVGYINLLFAIQLTGIVPRTILVFPLNALISWSLSLGFILIISYFIFLDIKYDYLLYFPALYIYVLIAAITSISILSRGQFIFMIGALIIFLLLNYKNFVNINIYKFILLIIISILFFLIVINCVTFLREFYFNGQVFFSGILGISEMSSMSDMSGMSSISGMSGVLSGLIVDRWIGMEGVMSVVSYEYKSFQLLFDSLTASAQMGKIDIYQYISNAHYKNMDSAKFAFATLPGIIAFLYYSGSLLVVFFGCFILVTLIGLIEKLVVYYSNNTLYGSIIGINLASNISQFGIAPVNLVKSLIILGLFLILLKIFEYIVAKSLG